MSRRRRVAAAVAAAAATLLLGRAVAGAYADYLWYAAAGASSVWRAKTATTLILRVCATIVWSAFLFANIYAVRRSVVSLRIPRQLGNLEIGEEVPPRYLDGAAAIVSLVLGALLGLPQNDWAGLLLARFGVPFGELETYFELDLGFYVYWLPFETAMRNTALVALLLAGAVVIFLYALTPSLTRQRGRLYVSRYVRRHLFALAAGMLLVLAWSYRLDALHLLLDGSGRGGAFTYVDHRANIPVSIALSILSVSAAALVLWAGWTGQMRVVLIAVGALLLVALALHQLGPVMARRSAAQSDPAVREQPYLNTRAQYTRRAYAADRVRPGDSSAEFPSTTAAAPALSVWDPAMLVSALDHGRRSGGVPRAVGWENTAAGLVAIVPGAPAAVGDTVPPRAWSVARVLAAASDQRGAPVGAGRDDPYVPEGVLVPPLLYDSARGYVILPDSAGRIAAPSLSRRGSRLAFAWALQNYSLLTGDLPQPTPRIVSDRRPRDRVRRLVPFFAQGTTLVPVVDADTLYWVLELYATSASYPLSVRLPLGPDELAYIQHAATAVLNSRTGRVHLLADSVLDPLARTWWILFPELFTARSALRPSLVRALPPPVDGIASQAAAFAYSGWRTGGPRGGHLSRISGADTTLPSGTPAMFAEPGGTAIAWGVPVLSGDDHVLGVAAGSGGAAGSTRWVPAGRDLRKFADVLDLLRRATDTAAAMPRGARVVHGAAQAVPVAGGILFLQTTYAWQGDAAPAVAAVTAIMPDGAVRSGRTLAEALGADTAEGRDPGLGAPGASFEARARALYQAMRSALARGDWAAFGAAYTALGEHLARGDTGRARPARRR